MRMRKQVLGDNGNVVCPGVVCRCGTGSFCPSHGQYGLNDRVSGRESTYDDEVPGTHQSCGGGRRIIRKKIGGD